TLDATKVARFTPHCAEGIGDLTKRAVRFDCVDNERKQIFTFIASRGLQAFEHVLTACVVPSRSQFLQSLTLALSDPWIHGQDIGGWLGLGTLKAIGADNYPLATLDLSLIFVRSLGNLCLNVAGFDRLQRAALLID